MFAAFCSSIQLTRHDQGIDWFRPLPCRSWRCPDCRKQLRRGVIALAISGRPNRLLTLTASRRVEGDPLHHRTMLHDAWRVLRLRIARELARPSWARWLTAAERRARARVRLAAGKIADHRPTDLATLPYFAVVERHQSGYPHLHILLRSGFIPQPWLSAQMRQLASSPIVDIRKVGGTQRAAAYVSKYLGKAPARFGNARAYWYSKTYPPPPAADEPAASSQRSFFGVLREKWTETVQRWISLRAVALATADGWFSPKLHARSDDEPFLQPTAPPWSRSGAAAAAWAG